LKQTILGPKRVGREGLLDKNNGIHQSVIQPHNVKVSEKDLGDQGLNHHCTKEKSGGTWVWNNKGIRALAP